MSWQAVRAIREVQTGSATRKAVLYVMADYAREDGSMIFASLGSIAERAELSRRSVITAVTELCSQGILIKEAGPTGGTSTYAIHPAIISGNAAHLAVVTCEADSHPPVQEIHTPCETVSHPPVKDVHTPVKELHTPCETPSPYISIKDPLDNPDKDPLDDRTPALVVIEQPLLEVPEDPWYDPTAFPNEDCLASMLGQIIESVPKFSGSADQKGCTKLAAQLREQFPTGKDGQIDIEELSAFLEEWAKFNRRNTKRGGTKDGTASLRAWVSRCEAQHRNTKRARERDRGSSGFGGASLLSGHELAALQFGGQRA